MASSSRRTALVVVLLLLLALLAVVFTRCARQAPPPPPVQANVVKPQEPAAVPAERPAASPLPEERLAAATLQIPEQVEAGAVFRAAWTGPDNKGDYLTIVRPDAEAAHYGNYRETEHGASLELTAPIEPGDWEVRYVTVRSRSVLARAALKVTPVTASLQAPAEVVLGASFAVEWKGPNNKGDFISIVPAGSSDEVTGSYDDAARGSPAKLTAPVQAGEAEIRYTSGQGRKVLARRKITVTAPETDLVAAAEVVAGAKFSVTWRGPNNKNDYLTVVPKGTPDGQYRNYADTAKGSPLELTAPIESGPAEIRYMTGTQARVLARRAIQVRAAEISIDAPAEIVAGSPVTITWVGPNNTGDHFTIVAKTMPDGQYGNYSETTKGSPLQVTAPIQPGLAQIRYMSGQGNKVLARKPLTVIPAEIKLTAPPVVAANAMVTVEWSGPKNASDYLTIVPKAAKDGASMSTFPGSRGSPAQLTAPKEIGAAEIRYMSGQGNRVLARREIEVR